jgi:hypothetical protein
MEREALDAFLAAPRLHGSGAAVSITEEALEGREAELFFDLNKFDITEAHEFLMQARGDADD